MKVPPIPLQFNPFIGLHRESQMEKNFTTFFKLHFTCFLTAFLICASVKSQNLIPNGSFENFELCPEAPGDMQAIGWSSSRGSCDYFNACNNEVSNCDVGVPCNVIGHQSAYDGQAYLGFIQYQSPVPEYREQITCTLSQNLVIGDTYYFSMKINRGNSTFATKASNGQGFLLTNELYNALENPSPAFEEYTYINQEILTDSTNWITISTSFVAEEENSQIVIGAFLPSELLDITSVGTTLPFGEAYYFIDDVRLSPDSGFVNTHVHLNKESAPAGLRIYPNPNLGVIHFNQILHTGNIVIRNTTGEAVLSVEIEGALSDFDCTQLPSGNYFLTLTSEKRIDHLKFIKL